MDKICQLTAADQDILVLDWFRPGKKMPSRCPLSYCPREKILTHSESKRPEWKPQKGEKLKIFDQKYLQSNQSKKSFRPSTSSINRLLSRKASPKRRKEGKHKHKHKRASKLASTSTSRSTSEQAQAQAQAQGQARKVETSRSFCWHEESCPYSCRTSFLLCQLFDQMCKNPTRSFHSQL